MAINFLIAIFFDPTRGFAANLFSLLCGHGLPGHGARWHHSWLHAFHVAAASAEEIADRSAEKKKD